MTAVRSIAFAGNVRVKGVTSTGVAATDTANLQAAHDALPAGGGTIVLDSGPYLLTADTVSFTKPVHLVGTGPSGANVANGGSYVATGSKITCASSTGVAIAVNADGCSFSNLYLTNTSGTTPTAGAGIQIQTYGKSTRIVDCSFENFYVNVDFQYGYEWYISRCHFFDPVYAGLKINDNYSADAGDPVVSDSFFIAGPDNLTPQAGIRWESGGALKVVGCKINGRGSGKFVAGIDYQIKDGASTEGPYVVGCSIENVSSYGIDVGQAGPSNTGTLNYMTIVGCQFGGCGVYGIRVAPTATTVMQKFTIVGNVLAGNTAGVYLSRVNYPVIMANAWGVTGTPLVKGSGVTEMMADETMAVVTTTNGTTAGTLKSCNTITSGFYKKFVVYLNGYQNSTGTRQSIFPPTAFGTVAVMTHDDTGASTYDTAVRLPISMGAPVTGMIIVEGY